MRLAIVDRSRTLLESLRARERGAWLKPRPGLNIAWAANARIDICVRCPGDTPGKRPAVLLDRVAVGSHLFGVALIDDQPVELESGTVQLGEEERPWRRQHDIELVELRVDRIFLRAVILRDAQRRGEPLELVFPLTQQAVADDHDREAKLDGRQRLPLGPLRVFMYALRPGFDPCRADLLHMSHELPGPLKVVGLSGR
eukprot:7377805-Prymnesium_polylepis.2